MKYLPALASCLAFVALSSCGKGDKSSGGSASSGDSSGSSSGSAATAKPKEAPDVPPKGPATPVEAARTLDLNDMAVMEGFDPKTGPQRSIANLSFRVKGGVKDVYDFYHKQLTSQRWKIDPNAYVADNSASASYSRNTFHVSLTVSPIGDPGVVEVSIHNHGNVDLSKLPRPPVVKTTYEGPVTAMYLTDKPVPDTAAACRDLLLKAGWQPYGEVPNTAYYKQNAIRLTVTVSEAPAEGNKTMISYFGEQMSADIPMLPDAQDVRYSDDVRRLSFESPASKKEVAQQYQQLLAKDGWKSTTDNLVTDDKKGFLVFREPGGGMMDLNLKDAANGCHVDISFTTAKEVAAMEKKWDEQKEAAKKAKEAKAAEAAGQSK